MPKTKIQLVWFKRDLRLTDHQPLLQASLTPYPCLLLYMVEPMLLQDRHFDSKHWRFVWQSIQDINQQLTELQGQLQVLYGDALAVLDGLAASFDIQVIHSHQEIGLQNTYARDKAVKRWCKLHQVMWHESPCGAVIRGARTRVDWDKHWQKVMRQPCANANLKAMQWIKIVESEQFSPPTAWLQQHSNQQYGGEFAANATLADFFNERGQHYHKGISKPEWSRETCSRLSPYLAFGNISLRQFYQAVLSHWHRKGWRRALIALTSRLHWHCHFMQKFESETDMQSRPVNLGYLDYPYRQDKQVSDDLKAWQQGQTGYPLVDACMRCLQATGYINFRMRAMLVSFLCHHLNIDWRLGAPYLASLFLDFEPGIHYPQFQMQAGVTGTNTIRLYNPTKQAQEQDANGVFIRQWLPELNQIPNQQLHQPWLLTPMEQAMYQVDIGTDYPAPIVDIAISGKAARDRLWSYKKRPAVKQEAKRIVAIHVRPNA